MKVCFLFTLLLTSSAFAAGDGSGEAVRLCRSISNQLVVSQCLQKISAIGHLDLEAVIALEHISNDLVKLNGLDAISNKTYPSGVAGACVSSNDLLTVDCLAKIGQ